MLRVFALSLHKPLVTNTQTNETMSRRPPRFDRLYTVDSGSGDVGVHASMLTTSTKSLGGGSGSGSGVAAASAIIKSNNFQSQQSGFRAMPHPHHSSGSASPLPHQQQQQQSPMSSPPAPTPAPSDIPLSAFVDLATGTVALGSLRSAMVAEAGGFLSPPLWGDATLDKVHSATAALGLTRPDSISSGAALVVLDVVAKNCGSYAPLLKRVHDQLESAIFQKKSFDCNAAYFDLYRASLAARLLEARKPQRAVARALERCGAQITRCAFVAWRGFAARTANARWLALERGALAQRKRGRARLRAHFGAWRQYMQLRCRVLTSDEAKTQLVRRLARYVGRLQGELLSCQEFCRALISENKLSVAKLRDGYSKWSAFKDWMGLLQEDEDSAMAQIADRGEEAQQQQHIEDRPHHQQQQQQQQQLDCTADHSQDDKNEDQEPEAEAEAAAAAAVLQIEERGCGADPDRVQHDDDGLTPEEQQELIANCAAEARRLNDESGVGRSGIESVVQAALSMESPERRESGVVVALEQQFASVDDSIIGKKTKQQHQQQQQLAPPPISEAAHAAALADAIGAQAIAEQKMRDEHRAPNARDVLDWVSSRNQCVAVTLDLPSPSSKCTNFSTDFQSGERLAVLAVSLGASRALLHRVAQEHLLIEKLTLICEELNDLNRTTGGGGGGTVKFDASDILGLRSRRVAKALACLYRNFSHIPVSVVPKRPSVRARRHQDEERARVIGDDLSPTESRAIAMAEQAAIRATASATTDDPDFENALVTSNDNSIIINNNNNNQQLQQHHQKSGNADREQRDDAADDAADDVTNMQLTKWYAELAASDSDLDDEVVDDEIAIPSTKATRALVPVVSTRDVVERTLRNSHRALEELNARTEGNEPPHIRKQKRISTQQRAVLQHRLAESHKNFVAWVEDAVDAGIEAQSLSFTNNSAAAVQRAAARQPHLHSRAPHEGREEQMEKMSTLDVLDCVLRTTSCRRDDGAAASPSLSSSSSANKILEVERLLHDDARLKGVRLRSAFGTKSEDVVISSRQLLTTLYVLNAARKSGSSNLVVIV